MIRDMHNYRERFDSIEELKSAIMDECKENVASDGSFQVGYFVGKGSSKYWLVSPEDIPSMYSSFGTKRDIMLWCDEAANSNSNPETGSKRQSSSSNPSSKRRQVEDQVDETVSELRSRHGTKYALPQLRLWARMIAAKNHESLDDPPEIPALVGIVPKRKRSREPVAVVAEAITSLAGALRGTPPTDAAQVGTTPTSTGTTPDTPTSTGTTPTSVGTTPTSAGTTPTSSNTPESRPAIAYSPRKVSELRRSYLQELRELRDLHEQGILNAEEYAQQKGFAISALCKLGENSMQAN